MNFKRLIFLLTLITTSTQSNSQSIAKTDTNQYWIIADHQSIQWNVANETRPPHDGNIKRAGKRVSAIVYHDMDDKKNLTLAKDVIFPQLRTYNRTDQSEWKKYRAYFRRTRNNTHDPMINLGNQTIIPGPVDYAEIEGKLKFSHAAVSGLQIDRTHYPSVEDRYLTET